VGFRGAIFSRVSEVAALHFRVWRAFVFWSMRYLNFRWPNEITIGGSEQKKNNRSIVGSSLAAVGTLGDCQGGNSGFSGEHAAEWSCLGAGDGEGSC
jgi:hypothetical protein